MENLTTGEKSTAPQAFIDNIDAHLSTLGFRRLVLDFWREPNSGMLHGVVLATSDDQCATWQSSQERDRFGGLFWGHYDLGSVTEGMNDLEKRLPKRAIGLTTRKV